MMRNTSKLVALGRTTTALTKSQVQVYSSSGEGLLLFSVISLRLLSCVATNVQSVGPRQNRTNGMDVR